MADVTARRGVTIELARRSRDVRFFPGPRPDRQNLFGVVRPHAGSRRPEASISAELG